MLKKGETVYCKNNKDKIIRGWITYPITKGNGYIITDIRDNKYYFIVNDKGTSSKIPINKFFTLSELRDTRINEILDI